MKPGNIYLLILILASALGLGLLALFGNTQPNVEVVVHNKSGQPLSAIHLKTNKFKREVVIRGIEVGAEVVVKFHSDGEDSFFLLLRFADGKEIRSESINFKPGARLEETVTEKGILAQLDESMSPAE